jgi:hypothetical protein
MATQWIEKSVGYAPTKRLFVRTLCCVVLLAIAPREAGSRSDRVNLFPKLRAGQTIDYQIRYHSERQTKTESALVVAEAPPGANIEVRALLQLEVLGVEAQGKRAAIHARTRFALLNSDTKIKIPNIEPPPNQVQREDPKALSIEFTIFPDGRVDQITGLDALFPEQQQAWQEWASRFAAAAVFPQDGVRVAQKWKSEESEKSPSPLAGLTWMRESTYVRNEPCRTIQMTVQGDLVESDQPPETCAVIVTTAALKQQSPPKNATPEDFRLHELRTMGTARGKNKTITYISLKTGLVVRASDEADQTMNVTVAKADGTNRVHYDVHAKSNAEVLLVATTPPAHP